MPELDAFERSLQIALRDFAERGVVPVDAPEFTERVARRTGSHPLAWTSVWRLAWLLLVVALLAVLVASVVFVGARLMDESPDERAVLVRTFAGPNISAVTISPDGEMLAATHYADVVLLDVDTSDVREILPTPERAAFQVYDLAFSPDATLVAAVSGGCDSPGARVRVWDVDSGQLLLQRLEDFDHLVTSVAFSPDGTKLAVGTGCALLGPDSAYVKAWDIDSGGQLLDVALPAVHDFVQGVTFSPDGELVAAVHRPGPTIGLWDVATGVLRVELHEASGDGWSRPVAFSPDGTRLASTGLGARMWDLASGNEVDPLGSSAWDVQDIAFSRDGLTVIGCSGDTVRYWDAETGALLSEVAAGGTTVGAVAGETRSTQCRIAVQGDGVLLATYGTGHDLRLWRVLAP